MPLDIQPAMKGTAEHRKASSACCGAMLALGSPWSCTACGQPCERVLSGPEVIELHG